MAIDIQITEHYHAIVIQLKGRFLGGSDGATLLNRINLYKYEDKLHFVIDFSELDFINSSGIGILISAHTSLHRAGGEVRLAALTKRIKPIFLVTKLLTEVFKDYETVDEAVQSFVDDPTPDVSNREKGDDKTQDSPFGEDGWTRVV